MEVGRACSPASMSLQLSFSSHAGKFPRPVVSKTLALTGLATPRRPNQIFSRGTGALKTSLGCWREVGAVKGLGRKFLEPVRAKSEGGQEQSIGGEEKGTAAAAQVVCWTITAIYVGWLFILPYAPGDPVWAISPSTIQMLIDLSLNFFFVLPLTSMAADMAGIHGLAPVLHPMEEGLFNFVIGWTFLFAPLLFTDRRRENFRGSLEVLWIIQMFLTNTVLAPYMAMRLSGEKTSVQRTPAQEEEKGLRRMSGLLTQGASAVGLVGAGVGVLSLLWGLFGRPESGFGGMGERWAHVVQYVGSERLAYAFVWDMALYCVFQPWLIGDNLSNVREDKRATVRRLRFVPYVGLVAYAVALQERKTV